MHVMKGHMSYTQSPEKGGCPTGEVLVHITTYCAVTPLLQQNSIFSVNFLRALMKRIIISLCNNWRMFKSLGPGKHSTYPMKINAEIL